MTLPSIACCQVRKHGVQTSAEYFLSVPGRRSLHLNARLLYVYYDPAGVDLFSGGFLKFSWSNLGNKHEKRKLTDSLHGVTPAFWTGCKVVYYSIPARGEDRGVGTFQTTSNIQGHHSSPHMGQYKYLMFNAKRKPVNAAPLVMKIPETVLEQWDPFQLGTSQLVSIESETGQMVPPAGGGTRPRGIPDKIRTPSRILINISSIIRWPSLPERNHERKTWFLQRFARSVS